MQPTEFTVPLKKLVPSPRNVRRTGGVDVADLAANIKVIGLLQCLVVLPGADDTYEVVAGSRRLKALQQLRDEGHLADDAPVLVCMTTPEAAGEASLAENTIRQAMHPADQFEAFAKLAATGMSIDDIAARFGVGRLHVEQRLRLARVAPSLLQVYRDGAMDLEMLQAFAVSDDQKAQERLWGKLTKGPAWERTAKHVRAALTKAEIDATQDPRAQFVGVAAYEAAGGDVRRDLFGGPNAGFLKDAALLDRLVAKRLEREAERLRAQGYADVQIVGDDFYCGSQGFDYQHGTMRELTPEQKQRVAALQKQLDEDDRAIGDEYERLENELEDIRDSARVFPEGVIKRATAFLSLDRFGKLKVEVGTPRADKKRATAEKAGARSGKQAKAEVKPVGETLLRRLGCQRTSAMRAELLGKPAVAYRALVHALARELFYPSERWDVESTLRIGFDRERSLDLKLTDGAISDAETWKAVEASRQDWTKALPKRASALWAWILEKDQPTIDRLMAFCVAASVDAVAPTSVHGAKSPASTAADDLVDALKLDMRRHWSISRASYIDALSKAQVLAMLKDAGQPKAEIERLAPLKASEIASEAERLLAGSGYLPQPLRARWLENEPIGAADADKPTAKAAVAKPKGTAKAKPPAKKR